MNIFKGRGIENTRLKHDGSAATCSRTISAHFERARDYYYCPARRAATRPCPFHSPFRRRVGCRACFSKIRDEFAEVPTEVSAPAWKIYDDLCTTRHDTPASCTGLERRNSSAPKYYHRCSFHFVFFFFFADGR